jgi:hypothetical protein
MSIAHFAIVMAFLFPLLVIFGRRIEKTRKERAQEPGPAAPERPARPVQVSSPEPLRPAFPLATFVSIPTSPPEDRFVRLAMARKVLDRDRLRTLMDFQAQKRAQGTMMPVWDCAVLLNFLDLPLVERLRDEAGDLEVDVLGDFSIIRKLGEGGMGTVWLAASPQDELVAVKVLSPQLARQRPYVTRFLREAQAAIKLRDQNIVRGIAVGEDRGRYYFVMEFVAGKSARQMIEEMGVLPVDDASSIILQVAAGLSHAHAKGIVHRDIKPGNILVSRQGVAKLADLGLARQTQADLTALTRTGIGMGTPEYAAPEQLLDAARADERSDIYSLGATWYHMVTGRPPFSGASALEIYQKHAGEPLRPPKAWRTDLPDSVSRTIERMMAKAPADRIPTALEAGRIIREDCLGQRRAPVPAERETPSSGETLWEVEVRAGYGTRRQNLFLSEVKERIRGGQIVADTPVRPVGSDADYQPAASIPELRRELPHGL